MYTWGGKTCFFGRCVRRKKTVFKYPRLKKKRKTDWFGSCLQCWVCLPSPIHCHIHHKHRTIKKGRQTTKARESWREEARAVALASTANQVQQSSESQALPHPHVTGTRPEPSADRHQHRMASENTQPTAVLQVMEPAEPFPQISNPFQERMVSLKSTLLPLTSESHAWRSHHSLEQLCVSQAPVGTFRSSWVWPWRSASLCTLQANYLPSCYVMGIGLDIFGLDIFLLFQKFCRVCGK